MKKIILGLFLVFIYTNINSQNLLDIKPTGYVTDIEGVFTLDQKSDLENLLKSYGRFNIYSNFPCNLR